MTITQIAQNLQKQADDLGKLIDTPVPNVFERAMSQFPFSSTNNGREIVRSKLKKMHDNPNDRTAKELDNLGFSVDFDDYRDHIDEIERNHDPEN